MLSVDEADRAASTRLPAARGPAGRRRVVVVDNACTDATARRLRASTAPGGRLARARVLRARRSTRGCARDRRRRRVLLLNADCVLDAGFLAATRGTLGATRRGLGRAAPDPRDRDDRGTGSSVLDAAGDGRRPAPQERRWSATAQPAAGRSPTAPVFGGDGAVRAVPPRGARGVRRRRGGLDEDMELWATDVDLAWRAQLLGWRCVYEPGAVAWHMRFYRPTTRAALAGRAPAPAVPQPPADDHQERDGRGLAARPPAHPRATRSSRSATRCCASAPARRLRATPSLRRARSGAPSSSRAASAPGAVRPAAPAV